MTAHSGLRTMRMANEWELAVGVGVGGRVAADGRTLWVRDYRHDPRRQAAQKTLIDEEGIRAAMCAPMFADGHVIGVLYGAQRDVHDWTTDELALLTEFAADCGAAIGKLRGRATNPNEHHWSLTEAEAALALQSDIAQALAASSDVSAALTVLSRRLGLAVDLIDAEGRSVAHLPSTREKVRCRVRVESIFGEHLEVAGGRELSDLEVASVRAAAAIFGLQLKATRTTAAAVRRAALDLVEALVVGGRDARVLRSDAALLGIDLRQPHHVVCVGAHRPTDETTADFDPLSGQAVQQIEGAVQDCFPAALTVPRNGDLVVLLPQRGRAPPGDKLRELLSARTLPREGLAAGIGRRCSSVGEYPESFGEAALALDLARRQVKPGTVYTAADLGFSGLLAAGGSSRKTLEAMVRRTLGPILTADADGGSQYVRTLRAWMAHDRNLERSGAELHVHPNTVRYRLARIQRLLELDLRNVDDRFQVDLALRVLGALEGATNDHVVGPRADNRADVSA